MYSSISEWTFEFKDDETLWNLRDRIGKKELTDVGDYHGFQFFYPEGIEIEDQDETKLREIFNFTEEDNVVKVHFQTHESAQKTDKQKDDPGEYLILHNI